MRRAVVDRNERRSSRFEPWATHRRRAPPAVGIAYRLTLSSPAVQLDARRPEPVGCVSPRPPFCPFPQAARFDMARKTVLVSDLSGEEIQEGKGAQVTIKFTDARKGSIVLDVTDAEAEEIGAKGRKQARRG